MLKLRYNLKHPMRTDYHYQIFQIKPGDPYQFFFNDTMIGRIEKVDGKWEQISGRETLDSIVEDMGKFIEENT